ncbi:speckle-type POZ protein-like [Leptopilina boulardi]|uniref:speckle-type POZ protein-like n=1 Tax=Leptopilina boulardi TaxID=63433 RepID=UPI0021F60428|nr:speckle-type POZ protein-like [Leptopilina boulardi]
MAENVQYIPKKELINIKWIIQHFSSFNKHESRSFNIESISNIKWIMQFSLYQAQKLCLFKLINDKNVGYRYKYPLEINLMIGLDNNCLTLNNVTTKYSLGDFTKSFQISEIIELRDLNDDLHVHLSVNLLTNQEKSNDMNSSYSTNISINNFKPFLMSDYLSDVVFKINNKEFPAHKIMLASVSSVFEKMFSHQMKENITNVVEINDVDPIVFNELLRYIYTGKIENINNMAFGLYELANYYDINKLQLICEQYLRNGLFVENVIYILELADRYNSVDLKNKCIKYIDGNFEKVKKTEPFRNLKRELLMDFICCTR